jgi:hypothetical protein
MTAATEEFRLTENRYRSEEEQLKGHVKEGGEGGRVFVVGPWIWEGKRF